MEDTENGTTELQGAPSTLELILRASGEAAVDRLVAELTDFGFERFWQEEWRLRAYTPIADWNPEKQARLEKRLRAMDVEEPFTFKPVAEKNWNLFWEEDLVPVQAGPFLIKPTWAETPPDHDPRFVLEVDPKMSFGTGHHESTRLALRLLASAPPPEGQHVLDAGMGTAVLALAAVRLGAAHVVAFDTDAGVLENARENTARNVAAGRVDLRAGTLAEAVPASAVPAGGFDLVLANINRNALSKMLPAFREKLRPGGRAVLAGLLLSDRSAMLKHVAACDFVAEEEQSENEWWAVRLRASGA